MRELADEAHIERFMRALGRVASAEGRVYLTGGATAVLHGWRSNTIDVDIKLVPDRDDLMREIPRLKEELISMSSLRRLPTSFQSPQAGRSEAR